MKTYTVYTYFWPEEKHNDGWKKPAHVLGYLTPQHNQGQEPERLKTYTIEAKDGLTAKRRAIKLRKLHEGIK